MVKFQDKMIAEGFCDERGAAFCASATKLPRGEYGLVGLFVKGNILNIHDMDIRSNVGELIYKVQLKDISKLKIRTFFLNQVLRFEYDGYLYSFTNFLGVKPALKVIETEANRT